MFWHYLRSVSQQGIFFDPSGDVVNFNDGFIGPEFLPFVAKGDSQTVLGAASAGVSPERFINWRWQMGNLIRSASAAARYIELTRQEENGFREKQDLFNVGISPYYMSLMEKKAALAHCPIRLQALPLDAEFNDPVGLMDPLEEKNHSPVKEIVHLYPDRVAFCVAQLCPVYCRYCYRKRRDSEDGLHFNRSIIKRGLEYISATPSIRDVLITGGDPFLASDEALTDLVAKIRAIPHVEIIRFGTRTPVTLPYRVTERLAQQLKKYHPIYVNTHFNSALEITPEAKCAVANLVDNGFPVGNQTVMLKGVNDTPEAMLALCRGLNQIRVRPYYVFHPHLVAGTQHLRVSLDHALSVMASLRGKITGLAIPLFIVDTPSGKIPVQKNHFIKIEGTDALFENIHGEIWREKSAVFK